MKKLVATLLAVIMCMGLLAGCGTSNNETTAANNDTTAAAVDTTAAADTTEAATDAPAAEKITLTVWCPQNQIDTGIMAEQQAAFAAEHPEWEIEWVTTPVGEDNAKTEVLKDVAAAADVFFFASDQTSALVEAGALARLGGDALTLVESTIAESVIGTAKVGEGVYGIPFTHNTFFMYYDKTLYTEDEVKNLDTMLAKDLGEGVFNFHFDAAGGWKSASFYYGAGLTVFGAEGNDATNPTDWNNETGLKVTNYLIDLINNPKVSFEVESVVEELAKEHKVGAWFDGSWNDQKYVDALGDDLGRAQIPTYTLDGQEVQLKGFYGSKLIGANAHSKNLQAAVAFAAFLGNEENQILRYQKSGQIPTNMNAASNADIVADPIAVVTMAEANNASVAQPSATLFANNFWTPAGAITTEINSGDLTKDNAQAKMDAFYDALAAAASAQ